MTPTSTTSPDTDKGRGLSSILRTLGLCAALLPVLALALWGLLTASFMLPNAVIADHAGARPNVLLADRADNGRVIDHHTECIGLSVGLYAHDPNILKAHERAILAESVYGCEPFMDYLAGKSVETHRDYFRYWHGHALLSRPLLSLMAYNDMRGALFTISLGLLVCLCWRLGRDHHAGFGLAFALPFFILNAHGYWVTATKFTTWALIMAGCLMMARRRDSLPLMAFFLLGVLTAGFDFLTAPALIFALPAMVYFFYQPAMTRQTALSRFVWLAGFWLFGYAGFWSMKFFLAAAFLGPAVWADILGSAAFRLRGESADIGGGGVGGFGVESFWPGAALVANIAALKTIWGLVALFFVAAIGLRAKARAHLGAFAKKLGDTADGRALIILVLALCPVIFMEILSNHAQIHAAFTQLNLAPLFLLAGLMHYGGPFAKK